MLIIQKFYNGGSAGAGEMAQELKILAALPGLEFHSQPHITAHNSSLRGSDDLS